MSEDLDLLLRDAGTPPTVELDMAHVADVAHRRSRARRIAAGAGALAVVGAVAFSASTLLTDTVVPPIDPIAPSEQSADDSTEEAAPGELAISAVGVTTMGPDVVVLTGAPNAPEGGYVGERTRRDGSTTVTALEGVGALHAAPVVAHDGSVWALTVTGDVVMAPEGEAPITVRPAEAGIGLVPLGPSTSPEAVLVREVVVQGGSGAEPRPDVLLELRADGETEPLAGFDVTTAAADGTAIGAALDGEVLVALVQGDDGVRIERLQAGEPNSSSMLRESPPEDWPSIVAAAPAPGQVLAGGVLAVEQRDGGDWWLHLTSGPGGGAVEIPMPDGAPFVHGLVVAPDAPVAALNIASPDGAMTHALIVDLEALAEGRRQIFRQMDVPGQVSLLPATTAAAAPGSLPACADPDHLNTYTLEASALWFVCQDAVQLLPEGVVHPFFATERFAGGVSATDETELLRRLQLWAEGPTAQEAAAGLTGGVAPNVATIDSVTVTDRRVTVDLAAGPQVGVLGTTTAGAQFIGAVVGMVLQQGAVDEAGRLLNERAFGEVRITVDGSCERWVEIGDGEPEPGQEPGQCPEYNETHAPWMQGGAECARDLSSLNVEPTSDVVQVMRWCAAASTLLSSGREAFAGEPSEVSSSRPATTDELERLVIDSLRPPTLDQQARGLTSGAWTRATLAELDAWLSVELTDGRLYIDLAPELADMLPLSTPFPVGIMEVGLAGTLLQLPDIDEVQLRVDGSCEAYEARMESQQSGPCLVLDASSTPWAPAS